MLITKECNNTKRTSLLGRIKDIKDTSFSVYVLKNEANRYLLYHEKQRINPSTPINVDYDSLLYYFDDHESYDRAQMLL